MMVEVQCRESSPESKTSIQESVGYTGPQGVKMTPPLFSYDAEGCSMI